MAFQFVGDLGQEGDHTEQRTHLGDDIALGLEDAEDVPEEEMLLQVVQPGGVAGDDVAEEGQRGQFVGGKAQPLEKTVKDVDMVGLQEDVHDADRPCLVEVVHETGGHPGVLGWRGERQVV